jgi:hypothetical protein
MMHKHPKQCFKPNSEECPSCFLVLNQTRCYFADGDTQALIEAGYAPSNIPRNSTARHRLLDQAIFNDDLLPTNLHDHKLIRCLRKDTQLLAYARSKVLSSKFEEDRARATNRALRNANSDMPLGLIYSQNKPSFEDRLHNALTAFNDKLDQLAPSGVVPTTSPPSYENGPHLSKILIKLNDLQEIIENTDPGPKIITFDAKTEKIENMIKSLKLHVDEQFTQIRSDTARQHSDTMRYLEGKLSLLTNTMQRSNAVRTSRSKTPKSDSRLHSHTIDNNSIGFVAISATNRSMSAESMPPPQVGSNDTITKAFHKSVQSLPAFPLEKQSNSIEAESALFDDEEQSDDESNDSTNSDQTAITMTSIVSSSVSNEDANDITGPRNGRSCSDININNWISYLQDKSITLQKPYHRKGKSSEIAKMTFDKHVKVKNATTEFRKELTEALTNLIHDKRTKYESEKKSKSSHKTAKPSTLWPARHK